MKTENAPKAIARSIPFTDEEWRAVKRAAVDHPDMPAASIMVRGITVAELRKRKLIK